MKSSSCICLAIGGGKAVAAEQFRRARRNASTKEGQQRGEPKTKNLLQTNDYHNVISTAKHKASTQKRRRSDQTSDSGDRNDTTKLHSILKLPFVNDCLARDVRQTVRLFRKDVHVVFPSGRSVKDMLVSSSFGQPECPRDVSRREKPGRGRPMICHACDAGMSNGQCLPKNVVYIRCIMECVVQSTLVKRLDVYEIASRSTTDKHKPLQN